MKVSNKSETLTKREITKVEKNWIKEINYGKEYLNSFNLVLTFLRLLNLIKLQFWITFAINDVFCYTSVFINLKLNYFNERCKTRTWFLILDKFTLEKPGLGRSHSSTFGHAVFVIFKSFSTFICLWIAWSSRICIPPYRSI
jgi:hypothetical protein